MSIERETWEFINGFADWFSAIGTVWAVVVALRLSRKQFEQNLGVHFSGVIVADSSSEPTTYYQVRVVNRGLIDVVVSGIHVTCRFSKQKLVIVPPRDALSTKVPCRLAVGETAQFFFSLSQFEATFWSIRQFVPRWVLWRPFRRFLKIGVYTSTGVDFMMRADEGMVKSIRSAKPKPTPGASQGT